MKVIQVNNSHRIIGGSDVVASETIDLLKRRGANVCTLIRDSRGLSPGFLGRLQAFAYGLYSPSACQEMEEMLRNNPPDLIHVHEVFPLISPWILQISHRYGVPVVMSCHNFRLICPTAHLVRRGALCELCSEGRESWCVFKNCRDNVLESIAFAMRSAAARKLQLFKKNVTLFLAVSDFVKLKLVRAGFEENRIVVLSNIVSLPETRVNATCGEYVAYAGRISPEKGIDTLLTSALLTGLPVRLAGDHSQMPEVMKTAAPNVEFIGYLDRYELVEFYRNARYVVVPSICFETFGLVVAEAMSYGLPVIASRIGGIPEQVEDGETGFLFEPGNSEELAIKMELLWDNQDLCRRLGQAGREKANREYDENAYYGRLMAAYERAISLSKLR